MQDEPLSKLQLILAQYQVGIWNMLLCRLHKTLSQMVSPQVRVLAHRLFSISVNTCGMYT